MNVLYGRACSFVRQHVNFQHYFSTKVERNSIQALGRSLGEEELRIRLEEQVINLLILFVPTMSLICSSNELNLSRQ